MGYSYGFKMGATYGAEDINNITKHLIGAGVSHFIDGETYSVEELNSVTETISESGITNDGLKVIKSDNANYTVKICEGTAIFNDGSTITVDSDGVEVEFTPNVINHVYAFNNSASNKNEILCKTEEPTSNSDSVMLALINADGSITDKRPIARSKIASLGSNTMIKLDFTNDTCIVPNIDKYNYVIMYIKSNDGYYMGYCHPLKEGIKIYLRDWGSNGVYQDKSCGFLSDITLPLEIEYRTSGWGAIALHTLTINSNGTIQRTRNDNTRPYPDVYLV